MLWLKRRLDLHRHLVQSSFSRTQPKNSWVTRAFPGEQYTTVIFLESDVFVLRQPVCGYQYENEWRNLHEFVQD